MVDWTGIPVICIVIWVTLIVRKSWFRRGTSRHFSHKTNGPSSLVMDEPFPPPILGSRHISTTGTVLLVQSNDDSPNHVLDAQFRFGTASMVICAGQVHSKRLVGLFRTIALLNLSCCQPRGTCSPPPSPFNTP